MKEFQKQIPTLKDNFINNKFPKTRRSTKNENIKISEPIQKNNLPELKLTKIKLRPISDPELDQPKEKERLKIKNKTGLKYIPYIPNKNKEKHPTKKSELMFPKIRKAINQANNYFAEQKEREKEKENNNISNNINIQPIPKNNKINKLSSKRKTIYHKRNEKLKTLYGTPLKVRVFLNLPKSSCTLGIKTS